MILILAVALSVGLFTKTEQPVDLLIDFQQYHYSQGLIWTAQDKDNYYAVLANAYDGQLYLLKTVDGQPEEIASVPIQIAVQF